VNNDVHLTLVGAAAGTFGMTARNALTYRAARPCVQQQAVAAAVPESPDDV
jgi:hypothetical protein